MDTELTVVAGDEVLARTPTFEALTADLRLKGWQWRLIAALDGQTTLAAAAAAAHCDLWAAAATAGALLRLGAFAETELLLSSEQARRLAPLSSAPTAAAGPGRPAPPPPPPPPSPPQPQAAARPAPPPPPPPAPAAGGPPLSSDDRIAQLRARAQAMRKGPASAPPPAEAPDEPVTFFLAAERKPERSNPEAVQFVLTPSSTDPEVDPGEETATA